MPDGLSQVLWLLALLQLKHCVADFFLLTPWMMAHRKTYLHPGGLAHVGEHLAGSVIVLVLMGTAPGTAVAILVAEGVFHYHVDFAKARLVDRQHLTPAASPYWYALGVDQLLHQLSYLAIAAWWAVS
jgi:hypothetical protein